MAGGRLIVLPCRRILSVSEWCPRGPRAKREADLARGEASVLGKIIPLVPGCSPCWEPVSGPGLPPVLPGSSCDLLVALSRCSPHASLSCVWTRTACPWSSPHLSPLQGLRGLRPVQAGGGFLLHRVQMKGSCCGWRPHSDPAPTPGVQPPLHLPPRLLLKPSPQAQITLAWSYLPSGALSKSAPGSFLAHSGRPCIPGMGTPWELSLGAVVPCLSLVSLITGH